MSKPYLGLWLALQVMTKSKGCLAHNQSNAVVLVSGIIGGLNKRKDGVLVHV